ncbi:MAG: GIY-YIG nuclease family protein, partial [Candidatus Buchananbacteria bacterium]|nr:GIY-YIG nuclease family protein [Candidatus Buchananbacteria bacterium]
FIVPRTAVRTVKDQLEGAKHSIYFLFGENEEQKSSVYIGKTRDFSIRLLTHDQEKDFWHTAFVFLDPPNQDYLESLAIEAAKSSGRYVIENSRNESQQALNSFEQIQNQDYFQGVKTILGTFGYFIFEERAVIADNKMYYLKSEDGADARAYLLDTGEIQVLTGSLARKRETVAFTGWAYAARRQFLHEEKLVEDVAHSLSYKFTEDIIFKTPSAAAATIKGSPINGWTAWRDEAGNTLDQNVRQ